MSGSDAFSFTLQLQREQHQPASWKEEGGAQDAGSGSTDSLLFPLLRPATNCRQTAPWRSALPGSFPEACVGHTGMVGLKKHSAPHPMGHCTLSSSERHLAIWPPPTPACLQTSLASSSPALGSSSKKEQHQKTTKKCLCNAQNVTHPHGLDSLLPLSHF